MSVYGEGAYSCRECGRVAPPLRSPEQLAAHDWEVRCPRCREPLAPIATDEEKPLCPASIYAINKRDHEEMFLAVGRAYAIPAVALRFFNTYGSRQALTNPYTGVAAIFARHLIAGQAPPIFEDGQQRRDFVHVADVARAVRLSIASPAADHGVFNVGSGYPISVRQVAQTLADALGFRGEIVATDRFRAGDVRHCFPCITRIRERLGYTPSRRFEDGVAELVEWVAAQPEVQAELPDALAQLAARGLAR
jgi:dTDP-L-rhamnose 4-epimerase